MVTFAQEAEVKAEKKVKKEKPARPAFESSFIFDNPTNELLRKNALEVQMGHRFGLISGGTNDLAGFWAPSNIRIGLQFGITDRINIGYGTTKFNRFQDFNLKVNLLQQTRSNKYPISITYYGNIAIDARTKENFQYTQDRNSYFSQLIFARRFSPNFSMQIAPSISHFNVVDNTMRNDMIAVAIGGRYKISPGTAIMIDYSQPITEFMKNNPHPGITVGFEFGTSAHAFQIFASNYNAIVPQKNYMYNTNDFFNGDILIGFNITRIYNF
ncbi:MAG: hypothetical protein COB60_09655 [Flavobacteriaceae bacterium]|nr:MAG: hypothetical protein COB60_09655 [Flavobacteriaceae bacterium]